MMAQKRRTFTLYSSSSSTTTFTSSGDSPVEPEKPNWGQDKLRRHPPVLHMVLEALRATQHPRGTSVAAIKVYILHKYPTVDLLRLKYLLRQALATGISRGLLTRPANSKARGATGSFKLVPKPTKKIQTKKTCPKTVPKNPGGAKEQDPKRPGKAKKDLPSPGQAKKDPRKPGEHKASLPKPEAAKDKPPQKASETKKGLSKPGQGQRGPQKASEGKGTHVKPSTAEKAPQNSGQTKGAKAGTGPQHPGKASKAPQHPGKASKAPQHPGKASKAPQHPGKASKAPQHPGKASKAPPSGKSTAAGGRTQPGADVHRKAKVKNRSSKPTSSKSKNGAVSPSGKEVKSQGPGLPPKAKA